MNKEKSRNKVLLLITGLLAIVTFLMQIAEHTFELIAVHEESRQVSTGVWINISGDFVFNLLIGLLFIFLIKKKKQTFVWVGILMILSRIIVIAGFYMTASSSQMLDPVTIGANISLASFIVMGALILAQVLSKKVHLSLFVISIVIVGLFTLRVLTGNLSSLFAIIKQFDYVNSVQFGDFAKAYIVQLVFTILANYFSAATLFCIAFSMFGINKEKNQEIKNNKELEDL